MRRIYLTLLLLVSLSFALRVHQLGMQELRGDEAFSWNYIQGSPGDIVNRIMQEGDPQPPLHYWLLWAWTRVNGDSEFALRIPSVFLSILLVPLMYQIGRRLFAQPIGFLAAGLSAIHPQQIWEAQDARNMYLLALVAILVATWLLPTLIRPGRLKNWIAYVLCGVFAIYSHYYAIFPLLAHTVYVLNLRPGRRALLHWIGAGLAIGVAVLPWIVIVLPIYLNGQLADPGSLPFAKYTTAVLGDLAAGPAFDRSIQMAIAVLFFGIALVAMFTQRSQRWFLLTWLSVPFVGIYTIIQLRSTFNAYYFFFAFPAAYLLIALGLNAIFSRARLVGLSLIGLWLIVYSVGLYNHYFDPRYSKTRGLREAAAHIAQALLPGDGFLANFPDPAQGYYLRNLSLPYMMLPTSPDSKPIDVDNALARLDNRRTWFIPIKAAQWDRDLYVQSHLLENELLAEDNQYNRIQLMLFVPLTTATPLKAQFADGIELASYYLTPNHLTLIWKCTSKPSADYTVFIHALAKDGFVMTQHDAPFRPPSSQWQPGQIILDRHAFEIPTDRPTTLVAGLYLIATGQRLELKTSHFLEPNATQIVTLNQSSP